jgi:hypothetical protein
MNWVVVTGKDRNRMLRMQWMADEGCREQKKERSGENSIEYENARHDEAGLMGAGCAFTSSPQCMGSDGGKNLWGGQ